MLRPPPIPLAVVAACAVIVAAVAVAGGFALTVATDVERDRFTHLRLDTTRQFMSALDPRYHNKSAEIGRTGRRLVVTEAIKGGAIFDVSGEPIDAFGETPVADFNAIRHGQVVTRPPSAPSRAEFHFTPALSGTPFHVILRVSTEETMADIADLRRQLLIIAVLGGLVGGVAAGLVVYGRVSRPARRFARAFEAAALEPASADRSSLANGRRDEIGHLASGIDSFFAMFAEAWRSRIMVADAILESAPFGVLQVTSTGRVIAANPAALALLGTVPAANGEIPPPVLAFADGSGAVAVVGGADPFDGECSLVSIRSSVETRHAIAGAVVLTTGDEAGNEGRSIVLLADASGLEAERAGLSADVDRRVADNQQLTRRQAELRMMLECCLAMLDTAPAGGDTHVEPARFAEHWLAEATAAGMIARGDVSEERPTVSGSAADIETVFRLALLTVYARVGGPPAMITVEGRGINFDTAGYTFRATAGSEITTAADWQVALAALRSAVRRVRGQVSEFSATEMECSVRIILRGAAERLSTGLSRAAG
ncbi:PAS domain-containing protein [Methylobrevis albus]|uniref:PAS domain-containing protein n=1 Tax=Methylobrevis albus TaxID=2793297 RepID=A0A931I388_9HYPH|nr:PAS domain-containing protein [Methylobrevis albus]MBH0238460.1 hypothetical protein [Methylobrevis albus]